MRAAAISTADQPSSWYPLLLTKNYVVLDYTIEFVLYWEWAKFEERPTSLSSNKGTTFNMEKRSKHRKQKKKRRMK